MRIYGHSKTRVDKEKCSAALRKLWSVCSIHDETEEEAENSFSLLVYEDSENKDNYCIIDVNFDNSLPEEPCSDVEVEVAPNEEREFVLSLFRELGVTWEHRPEYVKCVAMPSQPGNEIVSYCKRILGQQRKPKERSEGAFIEQQWNEWAFVDIRHAMGESLRKGRLLCCASCVEEIGSLLSEQTADRYLPPPSTERRQLPEDSWSVPAVLASAVEELQKEQSELSERQIDCIVLKIQTMFGRKPTRKEWVVVGYPYVDNCFVEEACVAD
jgi:hypothetical protein